MNKFKGFKLGKGKADIRKIGAAVVAVEFGKQNS